MSNRHRPPRDQGQPGKSQTSSGISPELAQLRSKMEQLEKALQEYTTEKNQWNSEVKNWVGKQVSIRLIDGMKVTGELKWIDRYTMCLLGEMPAAAGVFVQPAPSRPIIVHKGAIALMYQEDEMKSATAT